MRQAADFSISELAWDWREAEGFGNPMFFPTGEWVAFDANRSPRLLVRTRLTEETSRRITELPGPVRGGDWASDGYIYLEFGPSGIGRVAEEGGTIEMLNRPTGWSTEECYLLYNRESGGSMSSSSIRYHDFETGEDHPYLAVDLDLDHARFSPDGHWVTYEWGPVGNSRAADRRFPGGEDEAFASEDGAGKPMFSSDGRDVYFASDGISRTEFNPATGKTGKTERVYEGSLATFGAFDVDPTAGRPLLVPGGVASPSNRRAQGDAPWVFDVIVHWTSDLPRPKLNRPGPVRSSRAWPYLGGFPDRCENAVPYHDRKHVPECAWPIGSSRHSGKTSACSICMPWPWAER